MDGKCVRNPIQSNPNPNPESEYKNSAELQSTAALTLRLKDGKEYPAVDVMRELRTMKA